MSKGKKQTTSRPLPETQDAAASNGPGPEKQRTGSVNRLPSLRPKRDLTLGAAPSRKPSSKKTFTPTIPVRRKKPVTPLPTLAETSNEGAASDERGRDRERRGMGRERGEKGGRGRRDRDIVTSSSIFSMGPAEKLTPKREMAATTFGSFSRSENPRNNPCRIKGGCVSMGESSKSHLHEEREEGEVDMEVEEKQLFPASKLPPVQLPLDYSRHTRHKTVATKQIRSKVKQESQASDHVKVSAASRAKSEPMTAAQLFMPSEGSKGQFLFFQLPDCVPVRERREDIAMDTDTPAHTQSATNSTAISGAKEGDKAPQTLPSLRDLPDGLIGKIRVHKSGKVKLMLGDNTLDVAMGTPCGFLQELVSIRTDQDRPEMTVLGQMSHRLICTPDFQSLLDHERLASSGYEASERER